MNLSTKGHLHRRYSEEDRAKLCFFVSGGLRPIRVGRWAVSMSFLPFSFRDNNATGHSWRNIAITLIDPRHSAVLGQPPGRVNWCNRLFSTVTPACSFRSGPQRKLAVAELRFVQGYRERTWEPFFFEAPIASQFEFLSAVCRASREVKRERTSTESSHRRLTRWPPNGAPAGDRRRTACHHQARRGGGRVDTHR